MLDFILKGTTMKVSSKELILVLFRHMFFIIIFSYVLAVCPHAGGFFTQKIPHAETQGISKFNI
ncbi:hypothetical protein [Lactiplantibacillus plantarum]|uniref:hypothetical protein n=1 Tax=Lactiplantibacillus plantarum TaxID=1590 RepID=UPI001BA98994|nr:hypothetical protein [Lactiplantibacillus plantarum]MBS0938076.1 hypothetical protein [Lactiplantibacillus plantarum]MBS0945705.1 hypothetical protein [Lactiplantibacillus plantarum]